MSGARPGAYLVQLVGQDAGGQPFGAVTAGAVVPQSIEYRSRGANPALLDALARDTGGRTAPDPAAAFDPNRTSQGAVGEIGLPLLWLALLLLPFDIGLRRLLFARDQVAEALRRVGLGRLIREPRTAEPRTETPVPAAPLEAPKSAPSTKPPKAANPAPDLDRLRGAPERARRRARGEA